MTTRCATPTQRAAALRRAIFPIIALIASAALSPAASAQQPARPSSERVKGVLAGDPRLDRPVSLEARRIYLGELLEQLSAKSGAKLSADEKLAPLTGYQLTAVVFDRPIWEVMHAVTRLYSFPPDRWYWEREKGEGARGYVLRCSFPPSMVKRSRESFIEQFLLARHATLNQFLALPPERRAAVAAGDRSLQPFNDPRHQERNAGFFSFVGGLSTDELRSIIRGKHLEIPASHFTPTQRAFIGRELGTGNTLERVRLYSGGPDPTVYVNLGSVGAYGVLGGIWADAALREHTTNSWLGAGEVRRTPDQPVPAEGVTARPEELLIRDDTSDRVLFRLARLARINLLFDCPPSVDSYRFGTDYELAGNLPDVLQKLGRQEFIWKRSAPFLLFRRPDWPNVDYGELPSWPLVRDLRASAKANKGYLRPDDWLRMAAERQGTVEFLGEEFPDAAYVRTYQVLLRLVGAMSEAERRKLAHPDGAGWKDWSEATRRRVLVLLNREDAEQARMLLQWDSESSPPRVRLYFNPADGPLRPSQIEFRKRKEDPEQLPAPMLRSRPN